MAYKDKTLKSTPSTNRPRHIPTLALHGPPAPYCYITIWDLKNIHLLTLFWLFLYCSLISGSLRALQCYNYTFYTFCFFLELIALFFHLLNFHIRETIPWQIHEATTYPTPTPSFLVAAFLEPFIFLLQFGLLSGLAAQLSPWTSLYRHHLGTSFTSPVWDLLSPGSLVFPPVAYSLILLGHI